jgi:hypothetical protein
VIRVRDVCEEEEKDEQTRYDNQFETTLINWENIFLTIEGATRDPFGGG